MIPFIGQIDVQVRYAETDQMGVVYHTHYLVWCEIGRTEYLRSLGQDYAAIERSGVFLAVSEASARFHAAARYGDTVRVETRLEEVRSRSMRFEYVITHVGSGARLVTASTTLVTLDESGRPQTLPRVLRDLLERRGG